MQAFLQRRGGRLRTGICRRWLRWDRGQDRAACECPSCPPLVSRLGQAAHETWEREVRGDLGAHGSVGRTVRGTAGGEKGKGIGELGMERKTSGMKTGAGSITRGQAQVPAPPLRQQIDLSEPQSPHLSDGVAHQSYSQGWGEGLER